MTRFFQERLSRRTFASLLPLIFGSGGRPGIPSGQRGHLRTSSDRTDPSARPGAGGFDYSSELLAPGDGSRRLYDVQDSRYGARGDGRNDDTRPIQAAIDDACASGSGGTVFFPPGKYELSEPLQMNGTGKSSFTAVSLLGVGCGASTLSYHAAGTALRYQGGSGRNSGARVTGLDFQGSNRSVAAEVRGQNDVQFHRCRFLDNGTGILCHNFSAGTFTEYIQAHDCSFESTCLTVMAYRITAGTDSFNGCGLENCIINTRPSTAPMIVIDRGAKLYNAPLNSQLFINGGAGSLIVNDGDANVTTFHGRLRIEDLQPSGKSPVFLVDPSRNKVHLAGTILVAGYERVRLGKLYVVALAGVNSSGVIGGFSIPRQYKKALTTGTNTLAECVDLPGQYYVHLHIDATNYVYHYAGLLTADTYGSYAWTQLANPFSNNTAGYGAPTFGVSGSNLTITNANYPTSGVTCYYTVMQTGGDGRNAPLFQNTF